MAVITIREQSQIPTGFEVSLVIDGNNYLVALSDPFDSVKEGELEWYFEEWLRYPILDRVKAERVKASIKQYGEALFEQLFQTDNRVYAKYRQLINNCEQKLQIEIESTNPKFHAIHWEALKDSALPRPFSIDSILVRKSVSPVVLEAKVKASPTINILVVVARPNAEHVEYRTISRPLVEAIRQAQTRVNLEILRPGTYEALSKHLEAKGKGYYHIVHFDVHGSLKTYAEIKEGIEQKRYVSDGRYGREEIAEYEGKKAFLALEGENKGEYDLVEASEVADLLTGKGIPVCILNACQSAKQTPEDRRETSLGSRLMLAGMQMVVAMSYSVTVTAAEIMMKQIYTYLFANQDLNTAIRLSRRELYEDKKRTAYYNTEIYLEDWLLPIVYCRDEIALNLREFTPEEEEQYYLNLDSQHEFVQPTYSFVGRDIDILLIEKALLKHNILLLQGMGGTGKTTLLNYLREWWQVTKFAKKIFYFGDDEAAYTLEDIVSKIGKQIYNRDFQAQSLTVQWRKLAEKLRAESHILILDNLESFTGQALAIPNTLDETAREEIKKFLFSLVNGKTKVVLGSRIQEEWLKLKTFRDNIYQLRGLDFQARSELAEKIIKRVNSSHRLLHLKKTEPAVTVGQSLDELEADEDFERLMNLLAGYPLAMEVVLANLKNKSPSEILEKFNCGELNFVDSKTTKNCKIYYDNLSKELQNILFLISPFQGLFNYTCIRQYVEYLKTSKQLNHYTLEQLDSVICDLQRNGLISVIDLESDGIILSNNQDIPQLLRIDLFFTHTINNKLKEVDKTLFNKSRTEFARYYYSLAQHYLELMYSENTSERYWGECLASLEYENIYQALYISLEQHSEILKFFVCIKKLYELQSNEKAKIKSLMNIYNKYCKYSGRQNLDFYLEEIFFISSSIGESLFLNKDYKQAYDIFSGKLDEFSNLKNEDAKHKQIQLMIIYYELARASQGLKQFQKAKEYCHKCLAVTNTIDDLILSSSIYNQLGLIAQDLKQYQLAEEQYKKLLAMKKDQNEYVTAGVYHNLGWVYEEQGKLTKAIESYEKAIKVYGKYNDYYEQADTYFHFGNVLQKLAKYDVAEKYFKTSLDIYIYYKDEFNQARVHQGLGANSQLLGDNQQAFDYYDKAHEIYKDPKYRYSQGRTFHQLGTILQKCQEYQQVLDYYQHALNIYEEYEDYFSQGCVYRSFGMLYEKVLDFEKAQRYYLSALKLLSKYKEDRGLSLIIKNLANLHQKNRNHKLIQEMEKILNINTAEVLELFNSFNEK